MNYFWKDQPICYGSLEKVVLNLIFAPLTLSKGALNVRGYRFPFTSS